MGHRLAAAGDEIVLRRGIAPDRLFAAETRCGRGVVELGGDDAQFVHGPTEPAERARVRICEAPDCEWLFYDTSKNRSRRWCDMRQCGNRMKARRHYRRLQRGADGGQNR